MAEDIYQEVFSGFFHTSFEISSFLFIQFIGCDLWITFAMRINEDKVSLPIIICQSWFDSFFLSIVGPYQELAQASFI